MTSAEGHELIVSLVNSLADESRRKNEAIAKALEMLEARMAKLERKIRKKGK